ncbi:MAG: hypothetical protein ACO3RG_06730, partial [Nitriliruptoraceae bacterium]
GGAPARPPPARGPAPPTPPRAVAAARARDAGGALRGPSGPGGDLLVAVPARSGVEVLVDGTPRPLLNDDGLVRVAGVPADAEVEVRLPERRDRRTWLVVQGFVLLAVVSVGARPPRVAVRAAERRRAAEAGAAAAAGAAGTDGGAEVAG